VAPFEAKVVGIGLQRTGTTSLAKALDILGYRVVHWGFSNIAMLGFETWFNDDFTVDELLGIDAGTDNPFPIFFRELDANYPGSKFILTTRNKEAWLASCERLYAKNNFLCWPDYVQACHTRLYGRVDFDPEVFARSYDEHYTAVLKYFECMPDKLLIVDLSSGNAWKQLCPFLGKRVPQQEFPWENKHSSCLRFDRKSKLHEAIAVASEHTARKICSILYEHYRPGTIVDLGENAREWHRTFLEHGSRVIHTSGEWEEVGALQAYKGMTGRHFDLAISLDMAGKLSTCRHAAFVERLVSLSDVVIFSAGSADQSTVERLASPWQPHWTELFAGRDYSRVDFIRPQPWNDEEVISYYRDNILLFATERKQGLFQQRSVEHLGILDKLILQRNRQALATARREGRL
jgi:hypothetical protein